MKYTVISTDLQYNEYSELREKLLSKAQNKRIKDEIDLLTVLLEKYRMENIFNKMNPVQLLEYLLDAHELRAVELSRQLKISPGVISDILNYRKPFSKNLIRKLAVIFNLPINPFNRPYKLRWKKD